jgi:hypothetical protein
MPMQQRHGLLEPPVARVMQRRQIPRVPHIRIRPSSQQLLDARHAPRRPPARLPGLVAPPVVGDCVVEWSAPALLDLRAFGCR